ncbi:MAG: hypothetical protein OP8BY_1958 [Candidatus Saccharicenans subterraneus]|uniref:Uncharacterized protein n=1 Tax=Candidatus Saccharicenans subterraneus TaxID=2508984 RepID=A0A3E2BNR4_9BACT|nr:MAG: hypothetical protein OP8BY_1958 [Candidatus Saccharicenans subterraneum]
MPERVSLDRKIIRVFAVLGLVTFLVSLGLLIVARLSLGSGGELRQLAGADFFEKFGLWLALGSLLFALAGLKTASGIKAARRWAWPASLVLAVILLVLFPLGTIFGLKLLFDLFSSEVKDWFRTSGHIPVSGVGAGPEYRGPNPDLIRQLEEQSLKRKK